MAFKEVLDNGAKWIPGAGGYVLGGKVISTTPVGVTTGTAPSTTTSTSVTTPVPAGPPIPSGGGNTGNTGWTTTQPSTGGSGGNTPADTTPTTPTTSTAGVGLRDYLSSLGLVEGRDWTYDQALGKINIGNNQYSAFGNSIPGVTYDPTTGKNYVTDADSFLSAVGMGNTNIKNLQQQVQNELMGVQNQYSPTALQSLLEQLVGDKPDYSSGISYNEGLERAAAALNPSYELSMKDVLAKLAGNQVSRGFYGQLPADVVTQDAAARLEAEKNAAIAGEANSLVNQSASQAYQQNSLAQNDYASALSSALNMIGQARDAQSQRLTGLLTLLANSQNQANSDRDFKYTTSTAEAASDAQTKADALALWEEYGIATQDIANILGVPVGATTADKSYKDKALQIDATRATNSGSSGSGDDGDYSNQALMALEYKYSSGDITQDQAVKQLEILLNYGQITSDQYKSALSRIKPTVKTTTPDNSGGGFLENILNNSSVNSGKFVNGRDDRDDSSTGWMNLLRSWGVL